MLKINKSFHNTVVCNAVISKAVICNTDYKILDYEFHCCKLLKMGLLYFGDYPIQIIVGSMAHRPKIIKVLYRLHRLPTRQFY